MKKIKKFKYHQEDDSKSKKKIKKQIKAIKDKNFYNYLIDDEDEEFNLLNFKINK